MSVTTSQSRRRGIESPIQRLVLLVGFLAVTAAIAIAHGAPATGYELSMYAATPVAFWVGVALALACSILVAFAPATSGVRAGALLLGGESFVAIVSLPLIRGYRFYSAGDALSHLGWTRDVLQGNVQLTELIYPGTHTVGLFFNRILGLPLEHALFLGVVVFTAVFVVFVPLTVATITDDRKALAVAMVSGLLLLPINNISAHLTVFPSTMAIFFLPLILLLTVVYLTEVDGGWFEMSPVGILLAISSLAITFIHPQQAANLLLMYVTLAVVLLAHRWYSGGNTNLRPVYGQALFLAAVLVVWSILHQRITNTAFAFTNTVITTILTGAPSETGAIAQRTGTLTELGISPLEIFGKLFLVSSVYIGLAGLLLGGNVLGRLRTSEKRMQTLPFFGVALIPVAAVMVLYMLGRLQTIYFRHLGFIMVVVTVFGAIAIARGLSFVETWSPTVSRGVTALSVVVLAIMLALSLATVFPSPYIYQANSQVTDARMTGHQTAFAYEAEGIEYVGIRAGPDRFRDAIEGTGSLTSGTEREGSAVPFNELDSDLNEVYDEPRYLVVSQATVEREDLWGNIRYSEAGLERAGQDRGVNRVVTNGDFRLYYVSE
ncbi:hypothetical protein VB773_22010 [Haloarculaceae archaeon H-GB2-1]|nr:hypothetical protein [Haloarculaceae archaeon H-GB1-1]MEA5389568.1 hypothetical protein [Haloarculaceae archaeon H-GB11]MEA5409979.1 hypothetical protein [Haloarculaceae archaeon H-GB2-1]